MNSLPNQLLPWLFLAVFTGACSNEARDSGPAAEKAENAKVQKLKLPPGFRAEHLYSPSENKNGSWVAMTFDDRGRLIASDQYGALYRLELPPVGSAGVKIEKLAVGAARAPGTPSKLAMGYAQGLLYAFNSLYVMVNHAADSAFDKGSGFYRLQDTDHDDQFDKITLLKSFEGDQEHGPHSVVLAPDKQSLYVIAGNNTAVPEMNAYRVPAFGKNDNLFPSIIDPSAGDVTQKAPGGWVARVDPSGTRWELISTGLRNPFDLAFNEAGDLFTYDSDMEWDMGMPWYRPTRICHLTSGSEFGWRRGSGKLSPDYLDNLPPVLNIGQGSPTSLVAGYPARFPEKYRRALFAFDWSFGIIYAVHLQPAGASYRARAEEFISGTPLPVTDGVIGPDGALYFLTGGRRLDSDLYRVYYGNPARPNVALAASPSAAETPAGKLRKQLEQFHRPDPRAVAVAWPHLRDGDRFVRYAARVAVEHQPVSGWQERALAEKDPRVVAQAIAALARNGDPRLKNRLLDALMAVRFRALPASEQLDLLRAFEITLSRMGEPDPAQKNRLIAYLSPHYPATTNEANRSLSKLLVAVEAPGVVEKTLALLDTAQDDASERQTVTQSADLIFRNPQYGMDLAAALSNTPPAQQIYYAVVLSEAKTGWTAARRKKYFGWFHRAYGFKGGRSYVGFLDKAREPALKHVPKGQSEQYAALSANVPSANSAVDWVRITSDGGPGRNWKMADALAVVQNETIVGDFEQGKLMFAASACVSCHGMRGEGGAVGPDLTQLGTRFSPRDVLESIIEPSKVISDQYAATLFHQKDGSSVLGRLMNEDQDTYYVSQNPFAPQVLLELPKKKVVRTTVSPVSIMPPGLINSLNEEKLRNLMAYLVAGGNPDHPAFGAKRKPSP
ncbi:MAG: c-type cytochrome [Ferruginibacter sp.]|nr:c-type cytochrome [Cytophagales bacterium]